MAKILQHNYEDDNESLFLLYILYLTVVDAAVSFVTQYLSYTRSLYPIFLQLFFPSNNKNNKKNRSMFSFSPFIFHVCDASQAYTMCSALNHLKGVAIDLKISSLDCIHISGVPQKTLSTQNSWQTLKSRTWKFFLIIEIFKFFGRQMSSQLRSKAYNYNWFI